MGLTLFSVSVFVEVRSFISPDAQCGFNWLFQTHFTPSHIPRPICSGPRFNPTLKQVLKQESQNLVRKNLVLFFSLFLPSCWANPPRLSLTKADSCTGKPELGGEEGRNSWQTHFVTEAAWGGLAPEVPFLSTTVLASGWKMRAGLLAAQQNSSPLSNYYGLWSFRCSFIKTDGNFRVVFILLRLCCFALMERFSQVAQTTGSDLIFRECVCHPCSRIYLVNHSGHLRTFHYLANSAKWLLRIHPEFSVENNPWIMVLTSLNSI